MAAPKKEFCLRGHRRDFHGTYVDSKGFEQCRECMLLRAKKYRENKRKKGFKLVKGRWIKI